MIKPPRIRDVNSNSPNKNKSPLNIFNINQESLFKEIEEIDNKLKLDSDLRNDGDSDVSKEDSLSGSDSEPSLDNFDNDQLVKLLPTFVKKKSNWKN